MKIVECVPNFSEGRRKEVVDQIVAAITSVPGVRLLDMEMDPDHNRSVITVAGNPELVLEGVFQGVRKATELIDLNQHRGEHPRIGATDVIPFVPIQDMTMEECVALAERLGKRIAEELKIPVYLYEEAARRPERKDLAYIRRGEFEGLREAIKTDPDREPDFGPKEVHPTAGATVVGARKPLIAYNVNLGTSNLKIAKAIARRVRAKGGGLAFVKALGFELKERGIVQVSMNLVDYTKSPVFAAFENVRMYAERYGVPVVGSEIVGLVPQKALVDVADFYLRLENFKSDQIIEARLYQGETLEDFIGGLAAGTPTPGGGAAAALTLAQGYALLHMVASLTAASKKYADRKPRMEAIRDRVRPALKEALELIRKDSEAFERFMEARRMPKETDEEKAARAAAMQEALKEAAQVPLQVAQRASEGLEPALVLAEEGLKSAISDVGTAAQMLRAAFEGARLNVEINLSGIQDEAFVASAQAKLKQLAQVFETEFPRIWEKVQESLR